jgi:hypothetical protein
MRTIILAGFLASAAWVLAPTGQCAGPAPAKDKGGKGDDKANKPRFTISKETTYVTEPVDKDGYVDYVTALNKRLRQGVTPANNANVLLFKALGPDPDKWEKALPEFFKWMEIPAPSEHGDYFVDLGHYVLDQLKLDFAERIGIEDQLDRRRQRPWTHKQDPRFAAWLKLNEKPLSVVVEASKRKHYYSPLLPKKTAKGSSSGLIGCHRPGMFPCRRLGEALAARAMLSVGEGRLEDAWQDLLACHRLGRLVGNSATVIESFAGLYIESVAGYADLAFLDSPKLTAKRAKKCLLDLEKLPPMASRADKVDLYERLSFLDMVTRLDRVGLNYLETISGGPPFDPVDPERPVKGPIENIDWDTGLRNANQWYDRFVAAMRIKDRAVREKKLGQVSEDLRTLRRDLGGARDLAKLLLGKEPAKTKSKLISDLLLVMFLRAMDKVQEAADRVGQQQANLQVAFALAAYQREHGSYPKKLDVLAPKYLAKVPPDLFTGKPLVYRLSEKGYLLYSFGVNGKDDEGRGYGDDPPGDDLSIRMPLPELPKK